MTWPNRLKLLFGLIVVFAVVAGGTIVFTQRQNSVQSASAAIDAESVTVGAVYAGTVVKQLVEQGDTVKAGAPLFVVRSTQLARDLEEEIIAARDVTGADAKAGTYQIVAPVAGTVAQIDAPMGDFVVGGGIAAEIDQARTLTVEAEFLLSPRDYARVTTGAAVDLLLPDDHTISGTVSKVGVETIDGQAKSTVTVASGALIRGATQALYQPGTPVRATLHLRGEGPLAGAGDALRDFLRRLGL